MSGNGRRFPSRVDHVQPDSPVTASNTSQSTRQLEGRTNYLREVIESIEAGNLIAVRGQPLNPDVVVGNAVYWDNTDAVYDKALAGAHNDPNSGQFVTTEASNVVGIVVDKPSPATGTIALLGMTRVPPTVLENMIVGEVRPGRYYLSGVEAGKLVRQRPAVTVAVVYVHGPSNTCEQDSWIYINPCMKDFLEDHIHLQFRLAPFPAGSTTPPTSFEQCHEITEPDAELPGWLPADHESFQGKAPTGAVFGYNLNAHPELSRAWPPIPADSAVLEMFQHSQRNATQFHGLERVSNEYVKIDKNGIWWCTCCYGKVPWATDFDTNTDTPWDWETDPHNVGFIAEDSSASIGAPSASLAECPLDERTQLVLSFTKMTFATSKTVVTSIKPFEGAPLEFLNCEGEPSSTGDLRVKLAIEALIRSQDVRGGVVLKEIVDNSLGFNSGWVTEGLVAGSDAVLLNGSNSVPLNPDLPVSATNPLLHRGIVAINVQLDPVERELNPQVVKLGDALEREYRGVTYLAFPNGRDSGIRMRYNVPPGGLPTSPRMRIRAQLFGRSEGPFSAIQMNYYRIQRPAAGSPFEITAGDTPIGFDVVTPSTDADGSGGSLPADHVIEVESDLFVVAPGDTVFVELIRLNDAAPLYQNDIGLIRIGGIIVP